jgi:hypothetical protein
MIIFWDFVDITYFRISVYITIFIFIIPSSFLVLIIIFITNLIEHASYKVH